MSSRIIIMGDFFPRDEGIPDFENARFDNLFDDGFLSILNSADYLVCNLEGSLTNDDQRTKKCGPIICAPTSVVNTYRKLKINSVSLANNHVMDGDRKGYDSTIGVLEKNNIDWFGAGEDCNHIKKDIQVKFDDCTVAIYGVCEQMFNAPSTDRPGSNIYQERRAISDIQQLKKENDWVVVLYHGGQEYFPYPSPMLKNRCHILADAGADSVIVQHSHQLVGREKYHDSEILYGQGNTHFISKRTPLDEGVIVIIDAKKDSITFHYQFIQRNRKKLSLGEMPGSFLQRSRMIEDGQEFQEEFLAFSKKKFFDTLQYYRGKNMGDRVLKKLLPSKKFEKYLLSRYTEYQLLRILNSYRCDEHREVTVEVLQDVLNV